MEPVEAIDREREIDTTEVGLLVGLRLAGKIAWASALRWRRLGQQVKQCRQG